MTNDNFQRFKYYSNSKLFQVSTNVHTSTFSDKTIGVISRDNIFAI